MIPDATPNATAVLATLETQLLEPASLASPPIRVVTRGTFAASPAQVWDGLVFYEEIDRRPPLLLRWLLPVPIRTEGRIAEVGDEVVCRYEGGHLRKRLTRIDRLKSYEFEVAEQSLAVGSGLRLCGGCYTVRGLAEGLTEVAVETRYRHGKAPRWLWQPLERLVCHSFHRHLLGSMRRQLEAVREAACPT